MIWLRGRRSRAGRALLVATLALGVVLDEGAGAAAPPGHDGIDRPAPEEPRDARAAERARTTFDQARDAFQRRSYVAAASAFEQSASYVPHPSPWINAAEAWILAGDAARAARACDRVLGFSDVDEVTRAQAVERLDKVLPLIGTLELRGPTLAVRVDDRAPDPLPATLRLSPGMHTFRVSVGPETLTWTLNVLPGTTTRREVALRAGVPVLVGEDAPRDTRDTERRPEPPAERPPSRPGVPVLSLVGYGVAAAAGAGAVYFGLQTLDARDHHRDEGAESRFYLNRALTNVSLGVAVVAVVASTIVWVVRARR